MPFVAKKGQDIVWPDDVSDDEKVDCPECQSQMHVRNGHITSKGVIRARCFVHNPDSPVGGMCPGGESDQHKLMKYIVSRRFRRMYEHGTVEREKQIPKTDRIGDVVVTFDEPFDIFGKGVVGEVQYKNDKKDIEAVTQEYLSAGYSVYWFNESHFTDDFERVEFPNVVTVWPNAVPVSNEWPGTEMPEIEKFGIDPDVKVKIPYDYFDDHKKELQIRWSIGGGNYDIDLVRWLFRHNSNRKCDYCGSEASVYLFQDGVISSFRCDNHIPQQIVDSLTAPEVEAE